MQVRKQVWGEEVHHIPHTWVNSCGEAGFSRVRGGGVSQPKNWANSCRQLGLGVHPINRGVRLSHFRKILRIESRKMRTSNLLNTREILDMKIIT